MTGAITRAWLVLMIRACHDAGLSPIGKDRFHQLIYLSNCLAPLFEETPAAARIVKFERGPFYPEIQRELDHLSATGVIDISDVTYLHDKLGAWMTASYAPNHRTRQIVSKFAVIDYARRLQNYLTEVVFGYAALDQKSWAKVAFSDVTYATKADRGFINLDRENLSADTARRFHAVMPEGIRPSQRQELLLYLRLIEKLATGHVRAAAQ